MPLLSLDPTSLLVGAVVLLCLLWWKSTRRPPGLPPGPGPALPLLGHLHLMPKDPRAQFLSWRRQYGDVFSLYMGGKMVVVLASYSAIREALVAHADVFSHRPHTFIFDELTKSNGIVSSSGPMWKEQRKTGLEILRAMGMGKNVLAEKIQEEITHYIQAIKDHQGAPVCLCRLTQISISNNICSIGFGKRFEYGDAEFNNYIQILDETFKLLGGTAVLNFLPVLRHIPGDPIKVKTAVANIDSVRNFADQHVENHRKNLEERTEDMVENNDFIYSYLHQAQMQKQQMNVNTTVKGENLKYVLTDLFAAGTETTSSSLLWAMLFFLHYPHVQDKCFEEISDVIGLHRLPTMSDRPKMIYLEATICEVLRKGDLVPLSVLHATSQDVNFRGFVIPKDAVIIPYLGCVLEDPEIWGDPENFRPERFIGPDGKLTKPEEFVPFSTGRRVCLGESLGRMELFLYLATLIQHFRLLPAEEGQLPPLEGVFGLTHTPQPYRIRAVPRT
ncbi:cytochrome P450 2B4-like isoform X1 [Babylonia areolata]|uniref:cytochrome P450 2B4-like isoform X1 n=1 Tax=Babylonia areolata TaxID=304850 RepID=UPI003FD1EEFD